MFYTAAVQCDISHCEQDLDEPEQFSCKITSGQEHINLF